MKKILLSFALSLVLAFGFQVDAQKPVYKFTFKVYINEATATYYGGHTAVENLIKAQFTKVNQFYNQESRFTGTYNFVPSTFSYFSETGANQDKLNSIANKSPEASYNFRILYTNAPYPPAGGNANILADYQVTTRSVRFCLNAEAEWGQTLFGEIPTRILCHELGHSRGASDLYAPNVTAANNSVNGKEYTYPVASIMNYLYDLDAGWDTHSITSINASAATILTSTTWKSLFWSLFPSKMSIRVKNSQGVLLPNTKVTLYGVNWLSTSLGSITSTVYTTDSQGKVSFDLTNTANNPFKTNDVFPLYSNLMVVVGTQTSSPGWISVFDVQNAKIGGSTEYILDMVGTGTSSAPIVSITSPANNASFTAPASITINATAVDADGTVSKVEFYNGATLLVSDVTSPYSYEWTGVAAGTFTLTAKATDNSSLVTTSTSVTVTVASSGNTPPTVSLTSPANNSIFTAPASITLTATAADANGTVSKVDFYNGSTLLNSDATSPYSYAWTGVTAGTYSITAKATDNGGAITTSSVVTVVVNGTSTGSDFCLEAESALSQSAFSPFQVLSDANASGGKYIVVPLGAGTQSAPPTTSIASFSFSVPATATYYFWVRVLSPTSNSNSMFVRTDANSFASWTPGTYTTWTWKKWTSSSMAAGAHTIAIARNEDGLQVDKIIVSLSSSTPSGLGCGASARMEEEMMDWSSDNTSFFVSPNPSNDEFQMNATPKNIGYLSVQNAMGVEMYSESTIEKGQTIRFGQSFEPGVYHVVMKYEDGTSKSATIVKIK